MQFEVTPKIERLVKEFRLLAEDLHHDWLAGASEEARAEWQSFMNDWPTDLDVRRGLVMRSEDDLARMLAKAKRFRAILARNAPPASREPLQRDHLPEGHA
jgi:hypothetical protein